MAEVFDPKIEQTFFDIKSLKIQGASNVRKAIVEALLEFSKNSNAKTVEEFKNDLKQNAIYLLSARLTEPESKTAAIMILKAAEHKTENVEELKKIAAKACIDYEAGRLNALEKIVEYGSNIIPENSTIFTHCHSNTVELILARAKNRIEKIYCTETRPKFQGRITAENLAKKGFDVTLIVDSAAATFLKKSHLFISGADAILADGSVVNKIGTSLISAYAKQANVPHYIASSTHKFDPATYFGIPEEIEERPPMEIWENPPKNLKIKNPAFDITNANLIKGIITEKGVFEPRILALEMYRELELGKTKNDYLNMAKLIESIR